MRDNLQRGRPAWLLLRTAGHCAGWMGLTAGMSAAGAAGVLVLPALLGRTVDAVLGAGGAGAWVAACAAVVALLIASDALEQLAVGAGSARCTAWLRRLLLDHVLAAAPQVRRRFPPGDVVSRLVASTADTGRGPAAVVAAATAMVPTLGAPVALVLIDPRLALAFAAGLPALALVLMAFVRETSQVVASYQRAQATIAVRLLDALGGARTIAAAGTEEREAARVLAPLEDIRASGLATWRALGRAAAQGTLLGPLLQVIVLGAGGLELAAGRISPGGLLAASQYAAMGSGIGILIGDLGRLARARAGATRAADLLSVPPMAYGVEGLPAGCGRLEFRGVTVRRDGRAVLDGIDLDLPAGAAVAVVGRSGSGKSLLAAVAGRLADPDEGEVRLDGIPLPRLARGELRRGVQYAFERPSLLGETLAGAIRFGAWTPAQRQVEAAAAAACADRFIRRLPRGYETPLAEAPMSGGEAQRVGLARAFAHAASARLLVLDDATSGLDTATEMEVSRTITERFGQARLIVAHRAATAARADLVVWLHEGRVRACGPHEQLWADPAYRAAFEPA